MPELPEVETVKRTLEQLVTGKTIEEVVVSWPRMVKRPDDAGAFADMLKGETFQSIGRRGKFLLFHLDTWTLVSHLRMEGRYGLFQTDEEVDKHTHVRFRFKDGEELRYRDVRKFGTMHLFERGEELQNLPLSHLGVEPFTDAFTPVHLREKLLRTTRFIKSALLDQTVLAGLGNIYVDEALFLAGIHPERKANTITEEEAVKLHGAIYKTLKEAVEQGGSSIKSYVNGQGEMGMFQQSLFVYGKTGQTCKKCGAEVERSVVGGRGTHTCPVCQPS
ncbi:DNA-formamidopyrimidine glycosylase [Bacillus sp. H-16]|uniref:DNA-formamidopyrimidine glycosylase n=1 Tax=Alteribacter salitolerans TaxID=2912333 RepID=UPI001963DB17|nr:DNA-formamidopyrimidine glycosylase [Alteribacter salitolerans]MBM7096477.1 DNA-formamidopyrimidine glycosylase [Alteribacter salitolerans]